MEINHFIQGEKKKKRRRKQWQEQNLRKHQYFGEEDPMMQAEKEKSKMQKEIWIGCVSQFKGRKTLQRNRPPISAEEIASKR